MFLLEQRISGTSSRLEAAQQRYKKNYDASLRRQTKELIPGDYVYLRRKRKDPNDLRQKLAPVAG